MSRGERAGGDRRNPLLVAFAAVLGMFTSLIAVVLNWLRHHHPEPRPQEVECQVYVRRDDDKLSRATKKDLDKIVEIVVRESLKADSERQSPASVRVPPDSYDDLVRSAFADLVKPGRLLFNPPDSMKLSQTERVEVRLARTLELDAELLEQLRGHGKPQLEEIPTAPLMAVNLTGDGFRIKAYSDEEQAVTQDGITTWEFDIRAIERGQQRLVMSVSLRIPVPGHPSERKSIPVREATIDVQVGVPALVGHFVSGNWQWFIGTAIAAAAVLVAVLVH